LWPLDIFSRTSPKSLYFDCVLSSAGCSYFKFITVFVKLPLQKLSVALFIIPGFRGFIWLMLYQLDPFYVNLKLLISLF
jgi:hypothetical protein